MKKTSSSPSPATHNRRPEAIGGKSSSLLVGCVGCVRCVGGCGRGQVDGGCPSAASLLGSRVAAAVHSGLSFFLKKKKKKKIPPFTFFFLTAPTAPSIINVTVPSVTLLLQQPCPCTHVPLLRDDVRVC